MEFIPILIFYFNFQVISRPQQMSPAYNYNKTYGAKQGAKLCEELARSPHARQSMKGQSSSASVVSSKALLQNNKRAGKNNLTSSQNSTTNGTNNRTAMPDNTNVSTNQKTIPNNQTVIQTIQTNHQNNIQNNTTNVQKTPPTNQVEQTTIHNHSTGKTVEKDQPQPPTGSQPNSPEVTEISRNKVLSAEMMFRRSEMLHQQQQLKRENSKEHEEQICSEPETSVPTEKDTSAVELRPSSAQSKILSTEISPNRFSNSQTSLVGVGSIQPIRLTSPPVTSPLPALVKLKKNNSFVNKVSNTPRILEALF